MAEKTGVGAPERDDAEPEAEPLVSRRTGSERAEGDRAGDGSGAATRSQATVTVDEAPPPSEAGAERAANGSRGSGDDRSSASSRHPSMAQRLGLRPRGQLRARKVQRIVRRVDPWSVLKVSLVFFFCVWVMVVVAAVLLWGVAVGSGTVGSIESFIAEFLAFEEFRFNGDQLFQVFALGGLIGVFVATAVTAVLAVLFNLIADLTGGVRFTVVEEESARRLLEHR